MSRRLTTGIAVLMGAVALSLSMPEEVEAGNRCGCPACCVAPVPVWAAPVPVYVQPRYYVAPRPVVTYYRPVYYRPAYYPPASAYYAPQYPPAYYGPSGFWSVGRPCCRGGSFEYKYKVDDDGDVEIEYDYDD